MSSIIILHLSDLHWRPKDRESIGTIVNALVKDLDRFVKDGLSPDLIVFSGDLVFSGAEVKHFQSAYDEVLLKILKAVGLNKSKLFICPGNHDIDREAIIAYAERGLRETLIDRDTSNNFLSQILSKTPSSKGVLDRLKNYNRFVGGIVSKPPNIYSTDLLQINILDVKGEKIGLATFNSAWRCTGAPNDQDKNMLIVGEHVVDQSLTHLQNCDIKIAVFHHPVEWLTNFDQASVLSTLYAEFDLIMHGHIHRALPEQRFTTSGTAVFSQVGCLYENRDFPNSYHIIEIDTDREEVTFHIRTYFDSPRKAFDEALNVAEKGIFKRPFFLRRSSTQNASVRRFLRTASLLIRTKESKHLDMGGVLSGAGTEARTTFVCPPLAKRKHILKANTDTSKPVEGSDEQVMLEDLLRTSSNVLFHSARETGKTSLANHVAVLTSEGLSDRDRVPVVLEYRDFLKGPRGVLETFNSYYGAAGKRVDATALFNDGSLTLIVDNASFDDDSAIDTFLQVLATMKGNRVLLLGDSSGILSDGTTDKLADEFQRIFIRPLPRRAIRELSKGWSHLLRIDDGETYDFVIKQVRDNHLPRTGYMISLLIWAYQKQKRMERVNEAFLLNAIIDSLLEKADFTKALRREFDPVSAEITLQAAAVFLQDRQSCCPVNDLIEHLVHFFRQKALAFNAVDVFNNFVKCGVLAVRGSDVEFKYRCFQEYFFAKHLHDDVQLREKIIMHEAGSFSRELYILSGLRRRNADLLEQMEKRIASIIPDKLKAYQVADFSEIARQNVYDSVTHKKLTAIKTKKISTDQVDDLLDATEREIEAAPNQRNLQQPQKRAAAIDTPSEGGEKQYSVAQFFQEVSLYGAMLKNSEFDDASTKSETLERYLSLVIRLMVYFISVVNDVVAEFLSTREVALEGTERGALSETDKSTLKAKLGMLMSRLIVTLLSVKMGDDVATEKLSLTFSEMIRNESLSSEMRVFLSLVMFDVDQDGWDETLTGMIDTECTPFMLDAVTDRLWYGLNVRFEPEKRRKQLTKVVDHISGKVDQDRKKPGDTRQRINQAANLTKARGRL